MLALRASHASLGTRDPMARAHLLRTVAFAVACGLWIAFFAAAMLRPDVLDSLWADIGRQLLGVRVPLGVLLFPWTIAIAAWNSAVEPWLRDVIVLGVALLSLDLLAPNGRSILRQT